MATPEALVKAKVKALLKAAGIFHFSPTTYGMGRSGIPDIITCVNGYFLAIECKAGKGKTTALQDAEIANIKASGGVALVITESNIDVLRTVIISLTKLMPTPFMTVPTPTQEDHPHVPETTHPSSGGAGATGDGLTLRVSGRR
jgi:hypothetical protein